MKIALAMIVKGDDQEAQLLSRCLRSVYGQVDGIFITSTHKPGEAPNKAVEKVAERFHAKLSTFEWVDDFAAARNFNFDQVPKEYDYIMWTDADDVWRSLEKLKPTMEQHGTADAFAFLYLYDWDEYKNPVVVHKKTMVVRNDGSAKWVGSLHEDLEPLRALDVRFVDGIERLHLTNGERAKAAAARNVQIAKKDKEANPDDPRSYWNLGNSQLGVGDFEGARVSFETFLKTSSSDEEKYIVYQRLGDVYKALGMREDSVRQLQIAIGLFPTFPDAYLQLAFHYYTYGDLDKAEHYGIQGLLRRPQPQKMIVYNPRDYDYNPMMLLAKIYYHRNRPDLMLPLLEGCAKIYPTDPKLRQMVKDGRRDKKALEKALTKVQELSKITDKEVLRAELGKLPEDMQSHPAIGVLRNQNFVKETSSGRDLVIYCGMTKQVWNPDTFKKEGVGGSEEAVIHLAHELTKLGWNVTVYNNCGHKEVKEEVEMPGVARDGIPSNRAIATATYRPFWMWNYRDKQDVTILWRWTKPLDAPINSTKVFVDLHDVVPAGEFTEKRLETVSKIFVKTEFHRSLFPNVPDNKIAVIPNGFESYLDPKIEKDPMLMLNTSSPDRSMDVLPKLFKRVKEQVPEAKLKWCYGWDIFKFSHAGDAKKMKWMDETIEAMKDAGIEILGRLPQHKVGELYQKATILAYPTEFAEIDCISVKKAQAARCLPIASDFGALKESINFGWMVHSEKTKDSWAKPYQFHFGLENERAQDLWVKHAVQTLRGETKYPFNGVEEWAKQFDWASIAKRWNDELVK